ncbi:MAG: InlB B-repeat-containing protein, partial [Thermoplasmata archaeon]|nr:InlB B-repeat-containing protein [Thermoplasmata archaeon]
GTEFTAATAVTADITVYAKWTINSYFVTYNGNGNTAGTVPVDPSSPYDYGETVTVLGNTGSLVKIQDGISLLFTGWNTTADGSGTRYIEAGTFNMGSANVILYAQWSVLRGTGPAGGLIFYINPNYVTDGWRYLEAAPSDQSTGIQWYNGSFTTTGATGLVLGTGSANTTTIITSQGATAISYAAGLARAYTGGSKTDWFLPSKDELDKMWINLKKGTDENSDTYTPVGGFVKNFYWSSSEDSFYLAWHQNFGSGNQNYDSKGNTFRVRAVRAFRSIEPSYIVNYNANGATGGTVPSDTYYYEPVETVTVLGNTGTLVKTGYTFAGWNTQADGNSTDRAVGSSFSMGASNVTLYAKWTINNYTITFNRNDAGATGTMADQTIAYGSSANLTACTFTKTGWTFAGWATTSSGDVAYVDGAIYTMNTADDVTLYTKWTPPNTYSLRDIGPAGGWIFYDDEADTVDNIAGARYLEAAPTDQSASAPWGCYGTLISGADDTVVGTGKQNTIDILVGCATVDIAADKCRDYTGGGCNDWFLPSKDELNKMYINLKKGTDENSVTYAPVGDFAATYYWSSTENSSIYAENQNFDTGYQAYGGKDLTTLYVRAVRAF